LLSPLALASRSAHVGLTTCSLPAWTAHVSPRNLPPSFRHRSNGQKVVRECLPVVHRWSAASAKAGEGQAHFLRRIGIRPKPCGSARFPLGYPHRDIADAAGPQFGCSSEPCGFVSFPGHSWNIAIPKTPAELASEYFYSADCPFARSLPEGSDRAGLLRKVGSARACAFASRFFLRSPFHRFGDDHPCGCPPLPRWPGLPVSLRFRSSARDQPR
jgi:hypothetical protein